MVGEILLKLVIVLTPDDIRQMKAAGCGDEAKGIIDELNWMAVSLRSLDKEMDRKVWAYIQVKLNELKAALREG